MGPKANALFSTVCAVLNGVLAASEPSWFNVAITMVWTFYSGAWIIIWRTEEKEKK